MPSASSLKAARLPLLCSKNLLCNPFLVLVVHAERLSGPPQVGDPQEIEQVASRQWSEVLEEIRSGAIDEMQAGAAILLVGAILPSRLKSPRPLTE